MSGEFFDRKIRTLFHRFDVDNSGNIEESDFDKWAEKLVSFGNLSGDQAANLKKNIKSLWNVYFAPADVNSDGSISCEELIAHIKKTIADDSKKSTLNETIPLIFDAIDTDKDQSITRKEFANYFKSLNLSDDSAVDQIFNAMDSNSDGSINRDEFTAFGRNFFLSQNQDDPSKLFFGPLVQ